MPPLSILIKPVSSLCNMRCAYCFYADVSDHRQVYSYGRMTDETLEALIKNALAYADFQCGFTFQGGEPTLAGLDFYKRAAELQNIHNVKGVRIMNGIQTNGILIDEEWAAFLAENHFLVGLSIDGDAAAHDALRVDAKGEGTFQRAARAAGLLKRHGCDYNILCVAAHHTAMHPEGTYEALRNHGYIQFIPCIDSFDGGPACGNALTDEAYGAFLNATFHLYYRDYMAGNYVSVRQFDNYVHMLLGGEPENCAMRGACARNLVVEGDGSVYPCDFYVLDTLRLGNINKQGIAEILSSPVGQAFEEKSRRPAPECLGCRFAPLCRGGCRRDREGPPGEELALNRWCKAYQFFFENNIDRMMEMARLERQASRRF